MLATTWHLALPSYLPQTGDPATLNLMIEGSLLVLFIWKCIVHPPLPFACHCRIWSSLRRRYDQVVALVERGLGAEVLHRLREVGLNESFLGCEPVLAALLPS